MLQVKVFREEHGISQSEAVRAIKEIHPGMDKHLLSKVENSERYGVRLTNSAEQALEEAYATTACKTRRPETRRKPMRVQCRMSKRQYERLQQALKARGYTTMQDGIEGIITEWLNKEDNSR